ncbi:hypothetical protein F5879DRAFT_1035242 [Lentinula edodes]|nr:hypothetical protein F5879DRAFT_1035242 [Lentinula edodes]
MGKIINGQLGKIINDEPRNQVIAGRSIHQKHRWEIKVLTQISLCKSQPLLATADVVIAVTIINEFANLHQFDGSVITWLASFAVTDILITVTLVWILWKKRTNIRATDDAVSRIIRLTVQTGAITAFSAILDVILFLAIPNTTVNFVWDFALSKLYTNALISILNARAGWNNLNGQPMPGNSILFINEPHSSIMNSSNSRIGPSNRGSTSARNPEAGIITTGVYELDMGNQWAQTESAPSKMDDENALVKIGSAQGGRDLGSGVMVRTVVDMLTDPVPMPK